MALETPFWLDISLANFRANIAQARLQLAGDAKLMIAVKSEAYGHGGAALAAEAVAAGADALAVLDIPTGLALRAKLPTTPMLAWLISPHDDFLGASRANLTLGISHAWQLEAIAKQCQGLTTTVHLKIDTGLHRNGCLPSLWPALVAQAKELETAGVITVEGIWSHLADTSLEEDQRSLERFHDALEVARAAGLSPTITHIAASAAAEDVPEARLDMVRIGIIAFGVSPFDDRSAADLGFAPVMAARALITDVDESSATLSIGMGFAHGLMPLPPTTGWVSWGGTRLALKSVELDHLVAELPTVGRPAVGDVVTLFGDPSSGSPLAEDWATWSSTIGDEVVSALSPAVPRRYLND
jgi:alanine racemase